MLSLCFDKIGPSLRIWQNETTEKIPTLPFKKPKKFGGSYLIISF